MKPKPISLSDEQRRIVANYVSNVPPHWQERFVSGVNALLAREPVITNRVVVECCANTSRATMLGTGGAPELGDDD